VRFSEEDVDQARAAGVLIEFERGRPIIVDRSLYRELVKTAIKRTHRELEAKAAAVTKEKRTARATKAPADPVTVAKRERDTQLRELADQAHGANLDLGRRHRRTRRQRRADRASGAACRVRGAGHTHRSDRQAASPARSAARARARPGNRRRGSCASPGGRDRARPDAASRESHAVKPRPVRAA
jgi:hypothetical protein